MFGKGISILCIVALLLFTFVNISAQGCNGVFGVKLFFDDFGSGIGPGPSLPTGTTTYIYGSIGGGNYVVTNTTGLNGPHWHNAPDHTPDDINGYCLLFDASATPGKFYSRTFKDLCANTNYVFSCYVANIVTPTACGGSSSEPNLIFKLIDPTTLAQIGSVSTGNIPTTDDISWIQYSVTFSSNQNQSDILIEITNNANGGCGNDLAIDDFSFDICNPSEEQEFNLCLLPDHMIQIGSEIYNTPGIYETIIDLPNTCNDSIIYTTLTENEVIDSIINVSLCEGQTITINGEIYMTNTIIIDTISDQSSNCIEIITYIIDKKEVPITNQQINICEGDSLFILDSWIFEEGVYQDTLTSNLGCDSIVIINLDEIEIKDTSIYIMLCNGQTITIDGEIYMGNTSVFDTTIIPNACPEIIRYIIEEEEAITTYETTNICDGDSLLISGTWIYEEGIYQDLFTSESGCDSIVVKLVEMELLEINKEHLLFCKGESIYINGIEYTESISFNDTINISGECPKIINYILQEDQHPIISVFDYICLGDSLFIGGQWISDSGNYSDTISSSNICDSIINYTIEQSEFDISLNVSTIILKPGETIDLLVTNSSTNDIEYDWTPPNSFSCLNCDNTIFSPSESGIYSVTGFDQITGCAKSIQFNVIIDPCDKSYFPNIFSPNQDGLNDLYYPYLNDCTLEVLTFQIYDRWGNLVHIQNNVPIDAVEWDGSFQSKSTMNGVYIYILKTLQIDQSTKIYSGDITLIR